MVQAHGTQFVILRQVRVGRKNFLPAMKHFHFANIRVSRKSPRGLNMQHHFLIGSLPMRILVLSWRTSILCYDSYADRLEGFPVRKKAF